MNLIKMENAKNVLQFAKLEQKLKQHVPRVKKEMHFLQIIILVFLEIF